VALASCQWRRQVLRPNSLFPISAAPMLVSTQAMAKMAMPRSRQQMGSKSREMKPKSHPRHLLMTTPSLNSMNTVLVFSLELEPPKIRNTAPLESVCSV